MPATPAQILTNLLTDVSHILGNIVSAAGGVGQASVQLFSVIVMSVLALGRAVATAAVDLFQTTVGIIWGNLFVIVVLGIGYYFWAQRQPQGRGGRVKGRK